MTKKTTTPKTKPHKLLTCDTSLLLNYAEIITTAGRVEEAALKFTETGLETRVLDPSHVAMVDLSLPVAEFDAYGAYSDGSEFNLILDLVMLKKMLARLPKDEKCYLAYDKTHHLLRISAGGTKFKLELLADHGTEVRIPEVEFPGAATIAAGVLKDAFQGVALVCDVVQLWLSAKKLKIGGKAGKNAAEIVINSTQLTEISLEGEGKGKEQTSQFTLDLMRNMVRHLPVETPMQIQMGTDIPIRLDFRLGKTGKGVFFLAPRVEDSD